MKTRILLVVAGLAAGLISNASAIMIGFNLTPDRVLGLTAPGTPANPENEVEMVNFLVTGFNNGIATGTNLGNNPADPKTETNTLLYSASTIIPTPAPFASLGGYLKNEANPAASFLLESSFDWLSAKYGQDTTFYYIGDLSEGTSITIESKSPLNDNGLSHWTLFNPGTVTNPVPEGGATLALLGLAVVGTGVLRKSLKGCR